MPQLVFTKDHPQCSGVDYLGGRVVGPDLIGPYLRFLDRFCDGSKWVRLRIASRTKPEWKQVGACGDALSDKGPGPTTRPYAPHVALGMVLGVRLHDRIEYSLSPVFIPFSSEGWKFFEKNLMAGPYSLSSLSVTGTQRILNILNPKPIWNHI